MAITNASDEASYHPADPARISLEDKRAVEYWTKKLHCTESELRSAIKQKGPMYGEVKVFLPEDRGT